MGDITRSVGAGGDNLGHDVILVQLMLKMVKNQAERSYFSGAYTAVYGGDTAHAIPLAYLPMSISARAEAEHTVRSAPNLWADFRQKVVDLLQRCHGESEIAWMIVPKTGGWRTFGGQDNLKSDAGNGESVHHYGYAVDLTVKGLAWIAPKLGDSPGVDRLRPFARQVGRGILRSAQRRRCRREALLDHPQRRPGSFAKLR